MTAPTPDFSPEASDEEGSETRMTIDEFAAWCRENCRRTAQGFDDDKPCGAESTTTDGERVFAFCGWHWGAVL